MKRMLFAIVLMLAFFSVAAQATDIMPETTLLLPMAEGVNARWIIPPASDNFAARYRDMRMSFTVDTDGHAWLGFADGSVLCPQKEYSFKLPETFWDFVCLDNGVMLFATTSRLALLDVVAGQNGQQPTVSLQPVAMLPPDCIRMFKGADNCLYFICGKENGENSVWLFKPQAYRGDRGLPEFQKIFESEAPVNAVAGDGVITWVAIGRLVIKIDEQKRVQRYYQHPHQVIVDLEYSLAGGLFYSTPFAAGYLGKNGALEMLNVRSPDIACLGSSLYLLFSRDYGVMAVDGINQLPQYDQPLAGIKKVRAVKYDQ